MKYIQNQLKSILSLLKRTVYSKLKHNVQYKIIDVTNEQTVIWLQSLQTNVVFNQKISATSIDLDIIGKLLPEQACFWGILLGEFLKIRGEGSSYSTMALLKNDFFLYETENINRCKDITLDRRGNIIFMHPRKKTICSYDAKDIASDKSLINLFHPTVACYIGLYLGHKSTMPSFDATKKTKGNLRLITRS
ncbi:MAG: hypothetical protein NXI01_09280 [Gammaproteobacteria bacterium]|nr:hypothetical protein [Gammaproteobacteria bacterium]